MTRPDFVIALVGAVGSLLPETSAHLKVELERYGYHPVIIKVSASFSHVVSELTTHVNDTLAKEASYPTTGRYGEIRKGMAIGRAARERYEASHDDAKNGCLAELAIHAMAAIREQAPGPLCFIVDSLKTPSELQVLRRTYGQRLLAVGVHTPQGERKARLVHRIQQTVGRSPDVSECADRLIGIDEKERGTPFGQNVETVFAQCDAFIVASTNDARARSQVERLARLMFLAPFETPTAAETAMMHAFTASLCSASMSRHVGAAVTTPAGDLVATGCNEVPRFRGGPYRSEHACDGRDFTRGQDENAVQKAALVEQLLSIAQMEGVVPEHIDIEEAARKVSRSPPLELEGPHPWLARRRIKYEPVELTSRESTAKIAMAKRQLETSHPAEGLIDVALASNMISVGLDIDRLGLMVIAGQPKTTSEYIQSSSRVGRDVKRPGLVVTVFNLYRPRDRSHYERFAAYHQCFYRFVEATSVTPFSAPALDRGLAGVLVTLIRLAHPELTPSDAVQHIDQIRPHALAAISLVAAKAANEEEGRTTEETARVAEAIQRIGQNLLDAWALAVSDDPEGGVSCYSSFEERKGAALLFTSLDVDAPNPTSPRAKFAAGTSMRDVEPSVHLWKSKKQLTPMEQDDGI